MTAATPVTSASVAATPTPMTVEVAETGLFERSPGWVPDVGPEDFFVVWEAAQLS
jgi:hypothetical protein